MTLPELTEFTGEELRTFAEKTLRSTELLDPLRDTTPAYYIYTIYQAQDTANKGRLREALNLILTTLFVKSSHIRLMAEEDTLLGNIAFLCELLKFHECYAPLRTLLDRGTLSGETEYFSKETERNILRSLAVIQCKKLLFESVWELYWRSSDPYFWNSAFFGVRRSNIEAAISLLPEAFSRWKQNSVHFDFVQALFELSNIEMDYKYRDQTRNALKAVPKKDQGRISEDLIEKGVKQEILDWYFPWPDTIRISSRMVYRGKPFYIYYHSDIDGIVSCVLLMYLITKKFGFQPEVIRTIPVDFYLMERWTEYVTEEPAAVVDFLYHPNALIWFDHHKSPFLTKECTQHFENRKNDEYVYWGQTEPSVAEILFNRYERFYKREYPNRYNQIKSMVAAATTIDAATYKDVQQWYDCELDLSKINLVIIRERDANPNICDDIVQALFLDGVDSYVRSASFREKYKFARAYMDAYVSAAEKIMDFDEKSGIVIYDAAKIDKPFYRLLPYRIYPDARYTIGIYKKPNAYEVSVGKHPWKLLKDRIDVGHLCRAYGGGGHYRVGGITKSTYDEALSAAHRVVNAIKECPPQPSDSNEPQNANHRQSQTPAG